MFPAGSFVATALEAVSMVGGYEIDLASVQSALFQHADTVLGMGVPFSEPFLPHQPPTPSDVKFRPMRSQSGRDRRAINHPIQRTVPCVMMITLGANSRSWQSIAEAARAEAADIGADAVFMGQMGEYQTGSVSIPTGSTTTTTGTLNRSALRMNSQSFAGPTIAAGVERKQLSGTAILFESR
jgi:hypothetical protein